MENPLFGKPLFSFMGIEIIESELIPPDTVLSVSYKKQLPSIPFLEIDDIQVVKVEDKRGLEP